jgi:hypothetical protein
MLEKTTPEEKIEKAFQTILCRKSKSAEADILIAYYKNEVKALQSNPENTEKLIEIGEYRHENISDKTSLAALVEVIMTIYNLEEAIVRS